MSNLTFDELIQLGKQVKYSFNSSIAAEGDYTNLAYRKRVFSSLGAWMYEVNCSEQAGIISTDEAINGLFKPMQMANKNTILMFRESGVNPVQPKVEIVDQSAEVTELRAELKAALTEIKSLENANVKLNNQLADIKTSVRNLVLNNVVTKTLRSAIAK